MHQGSCLKLVEGDSVRIREWNLWFGGMGGCGKRWEGEWG